MVSVSRVTPPLIVSQVYEPISAPKHTADHFMIIQALATLYEVLSKVCCKVAYESVAVKFDMPFEVLKVISLI